MPEGKEEKKLPVINMITGVARPYNLPHMYHAMVSTLEKTKVYPRWILVFDNDVVYPTYVSVFLEEVKAEGKVGVVTAVYNGAKRKWGVAQRNLGLALVKEGYFFPHDDDSIVHPHFFRRMGEIMEAHPKAKGFIFQQRRWDVIGNLHPKPGNIVPGKVDSAMVLIHKSLVGPTDCYDQANAGNDDGLFIQQMYNKAPQEFVFVQEMLAYYNYLRIDSNEGMSSQAYRLNPNEKPKPSD